MYTYIVNQVKQNWLDSGIVTDITFERISVQRGNVSDERSESNVLKNLRFLGLSGACSARSARVCSCGIPQTLAFVRTRQDSS
jgi:hypothetical protein